MNKKKVIKIISYILIAIFIAATVYIVIDIINSNEGEVEVPKLQIYDEQQSGENKQKVTREMEIINAIKELEKENHEVIGWVEIEGTNISYPVFQTYNNDYYVTYNYKGKKSKDGALFLDMNYDLSKPSSNLLIYGHNNQNGKMFSDLLKYKSEKYYKKHPIITFTTQKGEEKYEIISAFYSKVYYTHETNVFRYYYFVDAKNEKEYNEYVSNCVKASIYKTGKTAKYGDKLITLSTCSYHTEDGRFAVVGRKRNN